MISMRSFKSITVISNTGATTPLINKIVCIIPNAGLIFNYSRVTFQRTLSTTRQQLRNAAYFRAIFIRIKPPFILSTLDVFSVFHAFLGDFSLNLSHLIVITFVHANLPLSISDERMVSEQAFE